MGEKREFIRNNEIQIEKWRTLLLNSSFSSPFQSWEFFQLCNSVRGFSAEVFAVEVSGNLESLCVVIKQKEVGLKAFFSRRAIIYGGPILSGEDDEGISFLLKNLSQEICKEVIYIEIRNFSDYGFLKSTFINSGWEWLPYLNIKLKLKDSSLDNILGSMKYNRKREIKQSFKEGTHYSEAKDKSDVEGVYFILRDLYLNKVKLPLPDLDFFLALYRSSIGKVFIVTHEEKIIGGSFCFYLEKGSIYTMYYCGIRNYHARIFPTHLSILAAIDFGIRKKLEYIDFMGAGLKDRIYGVRNYKEEFGGDLLEHGRFRKINNRCIFFIGKMGLSILKLLKK